MEVPAGVRIGMTRTELKQLLGPPTDVSDTRMGGIDHGHAPTILKWGNIEYWFGRKWKDTLVGVWDDEKEEVLLK